MGNTTATVTMTGGAVGDSVVAGFSNSLQGMMLTGYVSAANTATVVLFNPIGGAIDLASGTDGARAAVGPAAVRQENEHEILSGSNLCYRKEMGILRAIRAAGKASLPSAIISKWTRRSVAAAFAVNMRTALDPATKDAVDQIRERMAEVQTPRPEGAYGTFRTVAEHFVGASSRDANLAMLQALVRWHRAGSILEIGTAYGISAIAMAMAQRAPRLTTIEGAPIQVEHARRNIASSIRGVECLHGQKQDVIPRLALDGRRFDLVFHDGGHFGDDYVDDFDAVYPLLEPASVFVIDNIYHDDGSRREFTRQHSRRTCREGWVELVADPRVHGALVFRRSVGILLL